MPEALSLCYHSLAGLQYCVCICDRCGTDGGMEDTSRAKSQERFGRAVWCLGSFPCADSVLHGRGIGGRTAGCLNGVVYAFWSDGWNGDERGRVDGKQQVLPV